MRSGLFDSEITGYDGEGMPIFDRAESAAFFARYFSNFLSNGVFADPVDGLQIVPGSGRTVRVLPGYCYVKGYMGWQEKEEDLSLEGVASGTRTDGIVLRLSLQDRKISLAILKGTVELTRTDDIYELLLAEVTIQENAVQIVDKRADVAVCGFVSGLAQMTDLKNEVNQKAPLASPTFTGTVKGITKAMVGLPNVDNTSDVNKPISWATQSALNLKAPLANPTFTGMVSGLTKSMVGLPNVDNTSDVNKPISTAVQNALNLKAPISSPTFQGDVSVGGNLRLKGSGNYGTKINFGDGDYVSLSETEDDKLDIKASRIRIYNSSTEKARIESNLITLFGAVKFNDADVSGVSKDYTATIYASSWNSSAPYTQTVSVSGITSDMKPIISPIYSTTNSTAIKQKEAWSCVCKAVTATNQIVFTCFEDKPTTDIPIQIKVVK